MKKKELLIRTGCLLLTAMLLLVGCQPALEPMAEESSQTSQPEESREESSQEPEEEAPPEEETPDELTLVVVGDMMAHWDQVEDAYDPEEDSYDFSHCFREVAADLQEGYAIGNLETVFGGPEVGYSSYPRFSTPDAYGWAAKEAGFDFVSTCNNHSLDKDGPGLVRTLELLDEMGIAHTGTYTTQQASEEITLVEAEGMTLAILAFTFSVNGIPIPADSPWMVNMLTEEKLIADLAKARALEPDLIIVMPHMGNEYETYTRDVFLGWMDLMLYHGADLVFASHPHVLQKMLMRELTDVEGNPKQGFIICSMGNFISCQRDEPRDASILLKVSLSRMGEEKPVIDQISFVPIWVSYRDKSGAVSVRVVPVAEALESLEHPNNQMWINPMDADRLWRVNSEITSLYLGAEVPPEEISREYIFYERQEMQLR